MHILQINIIQMKFVVLFWQKTHEEHNCWYNAGHTHLLQMQQGIDNTL